MTYRADIARAVREAPTGSLRAIVFGGGGRAVRHSADLERVVNLPRRAPLRGEPVREAALVRLMTARLSNGVEPGECACAREGRLCVAELLPAQAWALYEAPLAGGILGALGVGSGKTGLDLLAAMVFPNVKLAVLLVPPNLRAQLLRDYAVWEAHFKLPSIVVGNKGKIVAGRPVVHVVPYSMLSRPEATALLNSLKPDLIVADEVHKLAHRDTATTSRVFRYMADHSSTRFAGWSGTLTKRTIEDYAHLAAVALGEGSPLPLDPGVLSEWASAVDPSPAPAPAGALRVLCAPGETLYQGFQRRLADTMGLVMTSKSAVDASISLLERKPPEMPVAVRDALRHLRDTWERPDGEEFADAKDKAACARQLACGFYYRWRYPRGEPPELIDRWFMRRKAWAKELREVLQLRREHLDSPHLCELAAERGRVGYRGELPVLRLDAWAPWREVRDDVQPETEAVWIDDWLARDAAEWGRRRRGVVWYEHAAFGRAVARALGVEPHGGGSNAEQRILAEDGRASIVASIKAHGTGRDGLQRLFSEQLVCEPPASGDAWEQLLGRLHRVGQDADEVTAHVYRHTPELREAIDGAVMLARYVEGTIGSHQKLLAATCEWER